MYAVWGCIIVLKVHTLWQYLCEPPKQHLVGHQFHNNVGVVTGILWKVANATTQFLFQQNFSACTKFGQMYAWGMCWKIMTHCWNKCAAFEVLMVLYLLFAYVYVCVHVRMVCWPINSVVLVTLKCQLHVPVKAGCLKQKHELFTRRRGVYRVRIMTECQRSFRHAFPELCILNKSIICHVVNHTFETGSTDNKRWSGQLFPLTDRWSGLPFPLGNKTLTIGHLR
jgi:hypothetical protein